MSDETMEGAIPPDQGVDPAGVQAAVETGTVQADVDYAFAPIDGIDKELSERFDADFIRYAKEAGLDKEAAAKLRGGMLTAVNEQGKARALEIKAYDEKCAAAVKEMFGGEFDSRMGAISKLIEKADGVPNGDFKKFFEGTKLMNDPTFVRFMDLIVRAMPGETPVFSTKTRAVSADDLKGDIARLMAEEAYSNAEHPDHTAAVEKVFALRRRLYGEI